MKQGVEGAEYITPLVFMVVLGTVLLNATTARLFAKLVGVFLKRSNAVMIIGASEVARLIARYLKDNNRRVVIIDSNSDNIEKAIKDGLESYEVNVYDNELTDNIELNDVGYMIAMTGSDTINKYAMTNFSTIFGEQGSYRLANTKEVTTKEYEDEEKLFTKEDDYYSLLEAIREFPEVHEAPINSLEEYKNVIRKVHDELKSIPILVKNKSNELLLISEFEKKVTSVENWSLVYVGKKLVF